MTQVTSSPLRFAFLAFLSLLLLFCFADARTASYWDSVTAVLNGENFYDVLGVTQSAELSEIKRGFRTMSKEYHPDRNPSPEAKEVYLKITMAFGILSDTATREEYDHLLTHGVPAQDRYYGRYAHRVGIPDHNPWIVFPSLFLVATGVHYLMSWNHYRILMRMVKRSQNYKQKRLQNMQEAGVDIKKIKKQEKAIKDFEPADDDPYAPPIYIYGATKPTFWDILPLAMIRGIYKFIKHFNDKPLEPVEELRRHMELRDQTSYTTADAELEMKKIQERQKQLLNSNKYKRYLRWNRQHGQSGH